MTQYILTGDEMRAAEAAADCGLSELMERAGAAVAEAVWRYGGGRPTLILCGPGNNGGDGYVTARLLKARGLDVRVAALREPRSELGIAARARWDGPVETLAEAEPAPVLVDALFGTGLKRALEGETVSALLRLAGAAHFTLAVDLPSGVGTDDGAALGAIPVDLTLALACMKPAHLLHPAAGLCGDIRVADIGVHCPSQVTVIERPLMKMPGANLHKYKRGYAVIMGGAMAGAAMLSAKAAMPLAGYVALVGGKRIGPDALVSRRWEDVAEDKRVGALLIGPGLGRDEGARATLDLALASAHPLVLDADALMLVSQDEVRALQRPAILTPHGGEFAAMFPEATGSKIDRARAAALSVNAVVVLKGADTVVAAPDGRVAVSTGAPGWLASAGTGDVLAGIAVALLSGGMQPFEAACYAVWLHSEAARCVGPGLIADDLPHHLPAAIAACL